MRYKIVIEYLGTHFQGWQRQLNALSVQQVLEEAISAVTRQRVSVHGAGRTDAGVHALHQVAHFDTDLIYDTAKLQYSINYFIRPHAITILDLRQCSPNFHARIDAKTRRYLYRIINRIAPLTIELGRAWSCRKLLDLELMNRGASYLLGHHDFTSFRATQCQAISPYRTIDCLYLTRVNDEVQLHITARSFLHHMVRNIVGTLVLVGRKQLLPEAIGEILTARDRNKAGVTAPAYGLYLANIEY